MDSVGIATGSDASDGEKLAIAVEGACVDGTGVDGPVVDGAGVALTTKGEKKIRYYKFHYKK